MKPDTKPYLELEAPHSPKAASGKASSATHERYRAALSLYVQTGMSCRAICRQCDVPLCGFLAYMQHCHREKVLARYGIACSREEASRIRLRARRGQTPAAHVKYRDAVAACRDAVYLEFNTSQVARLFGLDGTSLGNQLRHHYPEVLAWREQERRRLGLADNSHRGPRPWCVEQYARAVELLRTTQMTVPQAAGACGVSASGLQEHLQYYHRELLERRRGMRAKAVACKRRGQITGNGARHEPSPEVTARYGDAVRMCRTTELPLQQIARMADVPYAGLRHHLRTWHREVLFERRGAEYGGDESQRLADTKRKSRAAARKYAAAIGRLRAGGLSTAAVAAEFHLNAESFRGYLRKHEPELYARKGMTRTPDGRPVLRRSEEKYAEAVRLYETTPEPLKHIARRLGLNYNSLGGFVRRSRPEAIARHEELVAAAKVLPERERMIGPGV